MRLLLLLAALGLLGTGLPAAAQTARQQATRIGTFQDWTAAWYREGQVKICYAFTNATRSQPQRNGVRLMVTHGATMRDAVTLVPGYSYPRGAPDVIATVAGQELPLDPRATAALARNRTAAVAAFRTGREVVTRGSHPSRMPAIDHFSLAGFTAAYEAMSRECPAPATSPRR
ncbi:MAG TPA: hypothetical protein VD970_07645 [Acetobacteraceae bacterium]|nr:hypothetical protein [Acetobacteraceae bacterium]